MTEDKMKTVADVTKGRMLLEVLVQLRRTEKMIMDADDNREKLVKEGFEYKWYPDFSTKFWKEVVDAIDLCLKGLGECTERRNIEKEKEKEE